MAELTKCGHLGSWQDRFDRCFGDATRESLRFEYGVWDLWAARAKGDV